MSHYVIPAGTACKTRRSGSEPWADLVTPAVLQFGTKQRQSNEAGFWVFREKDGRFLRFSAEHVRQHDGGRSSAEAQRRRRRGARRAKPLAGIAAIASGFGFFLMPKSGTESATVVHDLKTGRAIGWFVSETGRYKFGPRAGIEKDVRRVFQIAKAG